MFIDPPPLPERIAHLLVHRRRAYQLEAGVDAGRVLHFIDEGPADGQPVLLVHGNPTWSFLWRKVIALLDRRRFRCLAPDLLGLGLSSKLPDPEDHQLERHLAALSEWVRRLELPEGLILVGQDWGGPLCVGTGMAVAERVAGVVLANTSVLVPRRPRGTWFHRFAALPALSDLVFRRLGFPLRGLGLAQGDRASVAGQVGEAYRLPLEDPLANAAPLGLARMVPTSPTHPSIAPLERIEAWITGFGGPIGLVWGESDPILGRALDRHLRAFPDAFVRREPDAGHFLQEEVPETLAAAIAEVARLAAETVPREAPA